MVLELKKGKIRGEGREGTRGRRGRCEKGRYEGMEGKVRGVGREGTQTVPIRLNHTRII